MKKLLTTLLSLLTVTIVSAAVKIHICGDSMSSIYGNQSNDASATSTYNEGMRGWGQYFGDYTTLTVQDWAHTGTTAKGFYNSANYWKAAIGTTDQSSDSYKEYLLERPYVKGYEPIAAGDYVILIWGHNDQKGSSGYKTITESEYTTYLTKMVQEVKDKGAYPILGTSICRCLFSGGALTRLGKIDACEAAGTTHPTDDTDCPYDYPQAVRTLAKTLGVPCLDLNAGSKALWEDFGQSLTASTFFPNGGTTHTSEIGARSMGIYANNTIKAWTTSDMNGATLSDYQPLIDAMKADVTQYKKEDYASQETKVSAETTWTFAQSADGTTTYSAGDVIASGLVDYNGLYLRAQGTHTVTAANASATSVTLSNGKTISVTIGAVSSGNTSFVSNIPETAGAAPTSNTDRSYAINTTGPGTLYAVFYCTGAGTSTAERYVRLSFAGTKVDDCDQKVDTKNTLHEVHYHATKGGTFCFWSEVSSQLLAVYYVPDADTSEDDMHEPTGGDEGGETTATKVPVIITAGQSNTDGRGTADTQPEYLKTAIGTTGISNVLWSYGNANGWDYTGGAGKFANFIPAAESSNGTAAGRWAYDAIAYYDISQHISSGNSLYVIKESAGGSSIAPASTSSGDRHWSVDATYLASAGYVGDGNSGTALSPALKYNIQQCVNNLVDANKTPDFRCIFWHQGESDRTPAASATAYHDNLQAVIAYFRQSVTDAMNTKYGVSTYDFSTLPFIMGTVSKASSLYNATIEKAMYTLASEDANVYVIDMQDGTMLADLKHFDAKSAELFGNRLYNKVCDLELLKDYGITADSKISGVEDAQYVVDFGTEHAVGTATTWLFNDYASGATIADALVDYNGMYLRATSGSHATTGNIGSSNGYTLTFSDDTENPLSIKMGAYCAGLDWSPAVTAGVAVTTANDRCYAVNVLYPGTFRCFVAPKDATSGRSVKLWFNGEQVGTATYDSNTSNPSHSTELVYTATTPGTFYITSDIAYFLYAAKYTPTESHDLPTVTTDANGYATFGNNTKGNMTLPEGLTAYTVDLDVNPSKVVLTEVTAVNAQDAVLVKGTANTDYTLSFGEGKTYTQTNYMTRQETTGLLPETSGEDFTNFSLNAEGKFQKADGTVTVNAGEAFLSIVNTSAQASQSTLSIVTERQKVFYVATTGSDDTGDGTESTPYATLKKALTTIGTTTGCTIYIQPGEYDIKADQFMDYGTLESVYAVVYPIKADNTSILGIRDADGNRPVLNFTNAVYTPEYDTSGAPTSYYRISAFFLYGNNLTLKDFEITHVQSLYTGKTQSECISARRGGNCLLENLAMHDGMAIGYYQTKGANNTLKNCDAYNIYDSVGYGGKGEDSDGFGFHLGSTSYTGTKVINCRAWWCADDGFDCINNKAQLSFEGCWAFYNGYKPGGDTECGNGNGFKIGGYGTPPSNYPDVIPSHTVKYCVSYYNKENGFYANHNLGGHTWENNTAMYNKYNFDMLNYNQDKTSGDVSGYDHILKNNVSYSPRVDGNNWCDINYDKCTFENNAIATSDMFVDCAVPDHMADVALMNARQADGSLPVINFLAAKYGTDIYKKQQGALFEDSENLKDYISEDTFLKWDETSTWTEVHKEGKFTVGYTNNTSYDQVIASSLTYTDATESIPFSYCNKELGGYPTGSTARTITFKVLGPCTIDIFASKSGSSSSTVNIYLKDKGYTTGNTVLAKSADLTTGTITKTSYSYTEAVGSNTMYLYCYGAPVNLYGIRVTYPTTYNVTSTPDGYASFCSQYKVQLPDGVKAYKGGETKAEGGKTYITLKAVDGNVIPANEGVILWKEGVTASETWTLTPTTDAATAIVDNAFSGTTERTARNTSGTTYVLGYNTTAYLGQYTADYIPANKAYYYVASNNAKTGIFFSLGDATGINTINSSPVKTSLRDGKYLSNGRIVIVKDGKKFSAAGCQMK